MLSFRSEILILQLTVKVDRTETESLHNLCMCDCVHAFVYYKPGLWGFHHIACHNNMTLHTHTIYVLLYIYVCVYVNCHIYHIYPYMTWGGGGGGGGGGHESMCGR